MEKNIGRSVLFCVLLALLTAAVYWQVAGHEFKNLDDPDYVTGNKMVQNGLSGEGLRWALTTTYTGNWHPVTWLSHMLDCQLFGLNAGRHHLVSLLIHLINAILVFLVLQRMTRVFWPSAFVAVLFAVHPLNVETVAWVGERKHLLGALFWLLATWAYARYAEAPGAGRYLLVTGFFVLGLLAHPLVVTLPLVLLLLDYWPLGRMVCGGSGSGTEPGRAGVSCGRLVLEKSPLLVLGFVSAVITLMATRSQGVEEGKYSLGVRLSNAVISYMTYVGKLIFPDNLAALYPHPGSWSAWQVAGALVLMVLISLGAALRWRSRPYLAVGWGCFLITVLPMAGLVQLGPQFMANRYAYVGLVGLFMMVAWGVADLTARWPRRGLIVGLAGVLVVAGYVVATSFYVQVWRTSITVFAYTLSVTTNNAVAHYSLGQALSAQGQVEEPIKHYREAVRIKPNYVSALNNLALSLVQSGRIEEATNYYGQALQIMPSNDLVHYNYGLALAALGKLEAAEAEQRRTLELAPENYMAHAQLGLVLGRLNQPDQALTELREALRLKPDYVDGLLFYGEVLLGYGQAEEAARAFREVIKLQPAAAAAHAQIGLAYRLHQNPAEAVARFKEALRLQPDYVEVLNNLAWLLATYPDAQFRNGVEAVKLAEKACELTSRKQPALLGTLAAAHAEAGEFTAAVAVATQAEQLARSLGQTSLAETNRALLKLYQERKPHRE